MAKASRNRTSSTTRDGAKPALLRLVLPLLLVGVVAYFYWLKVRLEPPAVLLARGIQAQNAGSTDAAMELYRKVLRVDPANHFAHYNLAQIHNAQGRNAEAQAHYQAALQAKPDFLDARLNLGVVLYRQKHFPAAAQAFREVLQASPGHPQALFNFGIAEAQVKASAAGSEPIRAPSMQ